MAGKTPTNGAMQDVQSGPAEVSMAIDRVGVKNLELPLTVRDRAHGVQQTVARVDLGADLPADFKGTHMSRFVEALEEWGQELDYQGVRTLLLDMRRRLEARRVYVRFSFPFFLGKKAPASCSHSTMSYNCTLTGELGDVAAATDPAPDVSPTQGAAASDPDKPQFVLGVEVPVMTVCPCSLAICEEGAHSQRSMVRIRCRFRGFLWLEELISIAEGAGSSQLYSLLKREDEKFVTEAAFNEPAFVEDVVRKAAQSLQSHPQVAWYRVEVESFESIHNHSAFAIIEKHLE